MTTAPPLTSVKDCTARALAIQMTAESLESEGDEWAAVTYFYSKYHLVKAAMIADPIFNSATDLSKIDANLTIHDRFATRHQGHITKGAGRELGVNDIVVKLYNDISVEYRRLHMASVSVRYSWGLAPLTLDVVRSDFDIVRTAFDDGRIRHGA